MNYRENYFKVIKFDYPEYIPMDFGINKACYDYYDHDALFTLMEQHPFLFPNFVRPEEPYKPVLPLTGRKDAPWTDCFGCVWKTTMDGIVGTVVEHPLDDYSKLKDYVFPNPDECDGIKKVDWNVVKEQFETKKRKGGKGNIKLRHGHTFLQLCDIRGYENLLFDMEDEDENLLFLIKKIEEFNLNIIQKMIDMNPDIIMIPEDLGMQYGPMLSVENFEKYILPSYRKYVDLIKKNNIMVHMHSDGDIKLLAHKIIENGVEVLNLQDLVNGVDWIRDNLKGKVCLDIDIDRQTITPYKTPQEIDDHIRTMVEKLYDPRGGLMFVYDLYPGVPLENIKAVMDAMEKYAFYKGE